MAEIDDKYSSVVKDVLENGTRKGDRTDTGTLSIFARRLRLDVSEDAFPIITKKQVIFNSIAKELKWFLKGETHIKPLVDEGISIWTPNAYQAYLDDIADTTKSLLSKKYDEDTSSMDRDEVLEIAKDDYGLRPLSIEDYESEIKEGVRGMLGGELGPVYGKMWREWPTHNDESPVDQIERVKTSLQDNPDSRRHVVSSWNPEFHGPVGYEKTALSPCHIMFQFWSKPTDGEERELSLQMYQRSADLFLGVPFNLTSYSLLLVLMSRATGHVPGEFIWTAGDVHLYSNHLEQAKEFLTLQQYEAPKLNLEFSSIKEFDAEIENYEHGPFLKAPIAT